MFELSYNYYSYKVTTILQNYNWFYKLEDLIYKSPTPTHLLLGALIYISN